VARRKPDAPLFALPAARRGRVERSVDDAVRAGRADNRIGSLDGALVALARAQARAVDVAENARDVWALARIGGELRETLVRLRLDPTSRGVNRDSLAEFLTALGRPAATDPASPAVVGYEPDRGPADVRADGHPPYVGAGLGPDAVAEPSRKRRTRDRPSDG
jgi:hypothetical protein